MLKLSARNDEPFWLDILPGVRMQFRPVTPAMMIAARRAAAKAVAASPATEGEPSETEQEDREALANIALVRSLAQRGVVSWSGVGDAAGTEIPPSPEAIDQLLDVWQAFDAIDAQYAFPALSQDAEKNA